MTYRRFLIAGATCVALHTSAWAGGDIALQLGAFDPFESDSSGLVGLQFKADPVIYSLRPIVGGWMDGDRDAYAYAGLDLDFALTDTVTVSPSAALGAYHSGSKGKDLGGA